MKIQFCFFAVALNVLLCLRSEGTEPAKLSDVVILYADDMGYGDLGI